MESAYSKGGNGMESFPINITEAIEWLSLHGRESNGGVTRTLYSKSWKEAQEALKGWMERLGFTTRYDSIGNLFGRLPATDSGAPTILVGSHVDTVASGGKYDGAYGILAGILAVHFLKQEHGLPKVNLEVVSLCEEEGSRFPIACWGSGMMTGLYSSRDIQGVKDSEGTDFLTAMKEAGFGIPEQKDRLRSDIRAFIELHIEQGPCLEKSAKQIGLVQTIVGQKRFKVTVRGESNHAGTTLMKYRKDALRGAAAMIHDLYDIASECDEDLVTTVGQLFVEPNVSNVIPSQVVFTVDARHPLESTLGAFCEQFSLRFLEIAENMGLEIQLDRWHEVKPVRMDDQLNEIAQAICLQNNISFIRMNSGAGHDSQLFAEIYPTALFFIPSQGGISHSPKEYSSTIDLENGLQVLIQFLHQLAYE